MTAELTKDPLAGLPLLIPVPQAAKLLGISRAAAYRFANSGDLPTKKLGRRVYVVSSEAALSRELAHVADKPIFFIEDYRDLLERGTKPAPEIASSRPES